MANKFVILVKRFVDHVKMAVEGRGIEHHGDSHLTFHQKLIHFCVLTWKGFVQNRCPVRASALAYTTLLALIPMLAVVASVSTSLLKSQGEKPIEYMIDSLVVHVAPQLDLAVESEITSKFLDVSDFENPSSLIKTLRDQNTPIAKYIWSRLSEDARTVFSQNDAGEDTQRSYLAGELNGILYGESIYNKERFAGINVPEKTLALAANEMDEEGRMRFNRQLLEAAFPNEIVKGSGRSRVAQTISEAIKKINAGGLGVTGMIGLVFVAIMLLATIEATFNDIWGVTQGRNWLSRIIQYWATVTLGPLIPVMAIALNTGSQFSNVEIWLSERGFIGSHTAALIPVFLHLVPFLVLSLAFALFYQLMPNTRVRWQAALVGGIVGGCLWQLNSLLQFVYASKVATYTNIYGPLSLVPIFLVGLYFSWIILLFGAQVAYTYQNRQAYFQERQSEAINEIGREFISLRIMTRLAQKFSVGSSPPTEIEIGQDLAVPTRLVGDILNILRSAGLVHETDGVEPGYTVARPLEKLTCSDILNAIRNGEGNDLETKEDSDRELVREQFHRIQCAEASVASELSLAEIVRSTNKNSHQKAVTPRAN